MGRTIYPAICMTPLVSCILFFSSCVGYQNEAGPPELPQAIISLDFGGLRSEAGNIPDNNISSLRALIYDSQSGGLELNIPFMEIPSDGKTVTFEVPVGIYDFVFIANEGSDDALNELLASTDNSDFDNIMKLSTLSFARSAFDAAKDIPMVALIQGVEITIDNTVIVPGMDAPVADVWRVDIEKLAFRLRLTITTTEAQFGKWAEPQGISISGIPDRVYLLPGFDNGGSRIVPGETFAASATVDTSPGLISEVDADGNVKVVYDRLILPELYLSLLNNSAANGLTVSIDFGDNIKSGKVFAPASYDYGYRLPRNLYLDMKVTVLQDFLEITGTVLPWEEAPLDDKNFDGQYKLTIDRTDYFFNSHGGTLPVDVTTDHPDGWKIEQDDIPWGHTPPTIGDNSIAVSEYSAGTTPRTGTFAVRAGNITKTIRVTQFPPTDMITDEVVAANSYIGAFWKADQTGERLINIASVPDVGDWTAIVAEGEEWIHLDTRMTTDPNVGWRSGADESAVANGNDPGFDETHIVGGNLKCVEGTVDSSDPGIYFRIGLNSAHTGPAPARYGVVLLSYANHTKMQRIWIRQGEDADYLFGYDDPVSGEISRRTTTVPISPYNLTAETLNAQAGLNGAGPNPGIFTDYPSQVGAYWQWASADNPRYAWDPYSLSAPGWSLAYEEGLWSALKAEHETCPEGYRRPSDGPIDAYVGVGANFDYTPEALLQSEIRQSLLVAPTSSSWWPFTYNTNYVRGYYADGFFDRRAVTYDSRTWIDGVSIGNRNIANTGGLFYNQKTGASLFIPMVGRREGDVNFDVVDADTGAITNPSTLDEYYWSATAQRSGAAWGFVGYPMMSCGLAIRCVKDGDMPAGRL